MLTGEGLIGKTIVTITAKAASKLLTLAFNKRQKIAQTLTKLYFATVRLDEVTDKFLQLFDSFKKNPNENMALLIAIQTQQRSIDAASETLAALSDEIYDALMILDPALANCLDFLKTGKENFLSFLSSSVHLSSADGHFKLEVDIPNSRILSTDFESIYELCIQKRARGEKHYWAEGVFDYFNDFERLEITFKDPDVALELTSMIRHQNGILKQAKESLRELLKNNLTLEEVFAATKNEARI